MGYQAQMRALDELKGSIDSCGLELEEKTAAKQVVEDIKTNLRAYETDKTFYRIVVITLGATILFVVVAITFLLFNKVDSFDALTAIGSAAIGGLVGLLAPSPMGQR